MNTSNNDDPKYPLRTLSKALEILNYLKDCPSSSGVTLNTISKDLNISKSSTHRILDTLLSYDFVEKSGSSIVQYRLSWAAYKVGISVPMYHTLNSSKYASLLEALSKEVNRTAILNVPSEYASITLYELNNTTVSSPSSHIGKRSPLYATASGKLFMLNFTQAEIRNYFKETDIKKYTSNTILNFIDFLDELKAVSARGYAIDNCELDENIKCIAMPIKDYTKRTVAAISISGTADNMTKEDIDAILPQLKKVCSELSTYLGY